MANNLDNRQIRVFISSTFQDMQAERDYLMTKVFPRLQEEAAKRDVYVIPLDLRWGITDNEAKSGKVLQICLEEIENSRPFFIGLLGNRYGWCPTKEELEKNVILKERWGNWLETDFEKGLSVTEIEMQYGVLRAEYDLNAFFYIKKDEDISTENLEKLKNLKKIVRENKRYPVKDYDTPEDLGAQVEIAFMELLNKYFPENILSEIDKEKSAQKVFTKSRTEVYVPNKDYYKELDAFLANPQQHNLVVVGESGIGKSSLLANWSVIYKDHEEWTVLFYPIGNRKQDYNHIDLLTIIYKEVCSLFHLQCDNNNPKNAESVISMLVSAVGKRNFLIIWDGINQLTDDNYSKSLQWLPKIISNNIKSIFSTTPDDKTTEIFAQRHYPQMSIPLLKEEERKTITETYLGRFHKNLTDEQLSRIVHCPINSNALVLKTMLIELVNFGKHDEVDEYINHYINAKTAKDFFRLVIKRFESSFVFSIVSTCLSSMAFSCYGLSEAEILELSQARPIDWSSFYCVLRPHIVIRNGLLSFSHQLFREAVIDLYSSIKDDSINKMTTFFESKITTTKESDSVVNYISYSPFTDGLEAYDVDTASGILFCNEGDNPSVINYTNSSIVPNRTYEELPFLYEAQKEFGKLYKLLLDFGALIYLKRKNAQALSRLWHTLEAENHDFNLEGILQIPYKPNREYATFFIIVAQFVEEYFPHKELVTSLYLRALEIEENIEDTQEHDIYISSDIYSSIAQYFLNIDDYDKAYRLFSKALQISIVTRGENNSDTASCYNYLGLIYMYKKKYDAALIYLRKALKSILLSENGKDLAVLANIYSNLALIYDRMHNYKDAIDCHKKSVECRIKNSESNNLDLAMSYNGLAYTYDSVKDYKKAIKYYMQAIELLTDSNGVEKRELALVYENLCITYCNEMQWSLAYEYVQKAYNIYLKVLGRDHQQTMACKQLLYNIMMSLMQKC